MKKKFLKHIVISMAVLLVVLGGFCTAFAYIGGYIENTETITFTNLSPATSNTSRDCEVDIYPRGGDSDRWKKTMSIVEEDGVRRTVTYIGEVYEITLTNYTGYTLTDWSLELPISEHIFINDAWCGTIELEQNTDEGVKAQELNMKHVDMENLELDFRVDGADLLFPLYNGDRIIYYPGEEQKETTLYPSDTLSQEYESRTMGIIIYYKGDPSESTYVFDEATIHYELIRDLYSMPIFYIFWLVLILWLVIFMAIVITDIRVWKLEEKEKRDEMIIEQSMSTFMGFIDAKDSNTNGHSVRVAEYAEKIADKMGFTRAECRKIYYIALMHDCGKIGIPENVLMKPGKLTDEEYAAIKKHTTLGGEILKNFNSIEEIQEGALYHHERYDGKGYPMGLRGEEIPIIARIICVADAFDAMNSVRCYRGKLSKDDILYELEANKGKQFDPKIVDCLLALIKEGKVDFS
ncbi:MAG: HD-GYP domain-containing protein [Lachnospiraceae bacterium]|nr:HD-GYP domain-containing protein [Lachnospiraceae bacterium]